MVSYIYNRLAKSADVPQQRFAARNWFRDQAQNVAASQVNPARVIARDRDSLTSRILPGRMYMFQYDPKLKNKLPYYDSFPLVFPIDITSDGFLGLNMHYLPPVLRAQLMDALYQKVVSESSQDIKTQVRISYDVLKGASQLRFFRPCIKRYLNSQVRSRFLYVNPDKWDVALMLPTARFKGSSINKVYRDSRKLAQRR